MIPLKAFSYYGKFVNVAGKLGFIPYSWESKTRSMSFKDSKLVYNRYRFSLALLLLYEGFLVVRCAQIIHEGRSFLDIVGIVFPTFLYGILNANHVSLYRNYGLHKVLLEDLMFLTSEFQEATKESKKEKEGKKLPGMLKLLCFGLSFASFTRATGVFRKPANPAMLTSVFPDPKNVPKKWKALLFLVHLYVNLFHYSMVGFVVATVFCYVHSVIPVIKRLRYPLPSNGMMSFEKMEYFYTRLRIMYKRFNHMFALWALMSEITTIVSVVVNIFLAVVYHVPRSLVVALVNVVLALYLFNSMADSYDESSKMLKTWSLVRRPDWFRRYRRACQPVKVKLGSYYFVDKSLVLTMLGIITVNSANLILTAK